MDMLQSAVPQFKNGVFFMGARLRSQSHLILFLALSSLWAACATIHSDSASDKRETALKAQKALVYNYLETGEAVKANSELGQALKKAPEDPELHMLMGLTQMALKNPLLAISYFKKAFASAPNPSAALNLSSAQIEAGQYRAARKTLFHAIKKLGAGNRTKYNYPERVFHNIALTYEKEKKLKLAEKYYQKALVQNSLFYLSLMRMGKIYQNTGRKDLAESSFRKAIYNCNKCLEPVVVLSQHYYKVGKKKEAAKILKEYLANKDLQPGDRSIANNALARVIR